MDFLGCICLARWQILRGHFNLLVFAWIGAFMHVVYFQNDIFVPIVWYARVSLTAFIIQLWIDHGSPLVGTYPIQCHFFTRLTQTDRTAKYVDFLEHVARLAFEVAAFDAMAVTRCIMTRICNNLDSFFSG